MSDNTRIEGKGHRRYQGRDTENNFFLKNEEWGCCGRYRGGYMKNNVFSKMMEEWVWFSD